MNINNLGLLNALGAIINEEEDSSDKAISEYLLQHLETIDSLTINEIVDQAFVSHSSIRRFCNKLGYKNFSELKDSFTDIAFPSNLHLREFESLGKYREELKLEITNMMTDMNQMVDNQTIEYVVDLIYKHKEIFFISANNTTSNLLKFQQELFYVNKIIRVVNSNYNNDFINKISKPESLIFVVSVSGVFAEQVYNIMDEIKGQKILITANRNEEFTNPYHEVIYLSEKDVNSDSLGALGKYGITYLFDLISEHYIYKYRS